MQNIPDQVPGGELTSAEFNQLKNSNQNLIESTGQVLSAADGQQLGKGAASYAAVSTAYTDSGVADAYVLSTIGSLNAPEIAVNFEQIRFRAAFANTGACSVNINGRGQVAVKKTDGVTDPDAGDISATKDNFLRYDSVNSIYMIVTIPRASETVEGIVERLTDAEAVTGTDVTRYVNAKQLKVVADAASGAGFTIDSGALSSSTSVTVAHGLGVVPVNYRYSLVVLVATGNWSVDDEIYRWLDGVTGLVDTRLCIGVDPTNFTIATGPGNIAILNKTTGGDVTSLMSNFKLRFRYN